VLELSALLPGWRQRIFEDLDGRGLLVGADPPSSERADKKVESAVFKEVAEELGNTPAVARGSYVDPGWCAPTRTI
jgi:DNA topoisomerase IB